MARRNIKAIALGAAMSFALAGCVGGSSDTSASGKSTTLTIGMANAPQSLAANSTIGGGDLTYYTALYDSLLFLKPDGSPAPGLTDKWGYDDARTTLTLHLRPGVKFSNGHAFDATAAKANLERNAKAGFNAVIASNFAGIQAKGSTTLVITLKQPDPALLSQLAGPLAYMQDPATFDDPDAATKPVGTGPYVLDSTGTVVGNSYSYSHNPNYWNTAATEYKDVQIKVFTDASAMTNAIKSGQIAAGQLLNPQQEMAQQAGWTVETQELDLAGLWLLDREGVITPALKDVRVRQAINLAINRTALLKAGFSGKGTATAQLFSATDGSPLDPALDTAWAYNPGKARKLLAAAGFAGGFDLTLPTLLDGKAVMAAVKQQLGAIGIRVHLKDAGAAAGIDVLAGKYAASYFGFEGGDPYITMQQNLLPNGALNPFRVADPKMIKLVKAYADASDADRAAALKALNAYETEQAWIAPWFRVQAPWATDKSTSLQLTRGRSAPNILNFAPKT
ncbi:ABC transporter substrate-binding protein [Streptomyces sp. NPDC051954]|uniref:ABC transporter substrate-binding protein n=1 Tax=unclassified Streptomyces TaxID=2593676 RepID=UPI00344A93C0